MKLKLLVALSLSCLYASSMMAQDQRVILNQPMNIISYACDGIMELKFDYTRADGQVSSGFLKQKGSITLIEGTHLRLQATHQSGCYSHWCSYLDHRMKLIFEGKTLNRIEADLQVVLSKPNQQGFKADFIERFSNQRQSPGSCSFEFVTSPY